GLLRSAVGRSTRAALIAASTSRAAPLMSRSMPNCSTTREEPTELDEVISVTSAMVPRWRSRGVATLVAIVSGLAPGICAATKIVGMSTFGSGATGKRNRPRSPARATPIVRSIVATGRATNGAETFMTAWGPAELQGRAGDAGTAARDDRNKDRQ